jgi:hypothetical protein
MAINLGDALSYLDIPQAGIGSVQLPVAKPFMPGYDQEMNIDDSGKITFKNYLQDLRDKAQDGIGTLTDTGLSLFDDSRRSNLMRAGLGSVLFGFSPLTAILGAVIGAKTPKVFDYFQQQRDKKAAAEEARAAQERATLDAYFRGLEASGGDSGDRYDGADSFETYSADPTAYSGSS